MTDPLPRPGNQRPVILIAGGGIAAVETLIALRTLAGDRIQLRLVAASPWLTYRPLAVEEPFGGGPTPRFSLEDICHEHDAEFHEATVVRVDPDRHHVFTHAGAIYDYDALVVAVGAKRHSWLHQAATLYGPGYSDRIAEFLRGARTGELRSIGFIVPPRTAWSLPLYELALMTSAWAARRNVDVAVKLFTPERCPLEVFGGAASDAVRELLENHGVELNLESPVSPATAEELDAGGLVTLPHMTGPAMPGLATDDDGYIRVDEHGRTAGHQDIYAAGDGTTAPLKQGGLASQQADTVAQELATRAGATFHRSPFQGTLRAVLLTGDEPLYMETDVEGGSETTRVARHPLWWPPAKVAASYLSDYLYERTPGNSPVSA